MTPDYSESLILARQHLRRAEDLIVDKNNLTAAFSECGGALLCVHNLLVAIELLAIKAARK